MKKVTRNSLKPSRNERIAYGKVQFYTLMCFVENLGAKNISITSERDFSFDFDGKRCHLHLHYTYDMLTIHNGEYYEVSYMENGRKTRSEFDTIYLENCFQVVALFLGYDFENGRVMTWQEKKDRFGHLCLNWHLRHNDDKPAYLND